jgi:fibronectin type 3 domain-containing protein
MCSSKSHRHVGAFLGIALLAGAAVQAEGVLAPPDQLQVVEAGLRKISLSWVPSPDPTVAGYAVYRQSGKDGQLKQISTVRGWQSSRYTDEGRLFRRLQDDTEYLYCVAAFTDDGRISVPTSTVRAVTRGAPAPVVDLVAEGAARRVVLRWRASPELEVTGYRIWRARARDAEYSRVGARFRRQEATFSDNGLDDLTDYYYMVTAINSVGLESEPCQPVQVRTLAPPLTPLGLSASNNDRDRVELRWEPNPEVKISHYEVLRSTKADRGYKVIGKAAPREPRFLDLAVRNGTLYFYSVLAVDLDGLRSQPSSPVRAFPSSLPLAPDGLRARVMDRGVMLTWARSEDPNVAGYLVYRKRGYRWQVVGRTREPSYLVSGLDAQQLYKFRISAFLANGLESQPTDIIRVKTDQASAADATFASANQ